MTGSLLSLWMAPILARAVYFQAPQIYIMHSAAGRDGARRIVKCRRIAGGSIHTAKREELLRGVSGPLGHFSVILPRPNGIAHWKCLLMRKHDSFTDGTVAVDIPAMQAA